MQEEPRFDSFAERQRAMFKEYKSKCFVSNKAALACLSLFIFFILLVTLTVYFTHPARKELERLRAPGAGVRWLSENRVVRLPSALSPTHYNVHLRPDIYTGNNGTFFFNGSVLIRINCEKPTYTVTVYSHGLEIERGSVFVRRVTDEYKIPVSDVYLQPDAQLLHIDLNEKLVESNQYDVHIQFRGELKNGVAGMFYSSHTSRNGETEYAVGTALEPVYGRMVLPCFEEPAFKATFNLTIDRKDGYQSKSNTEIWRVETLENGWYSDHYTRTPRMSLYLLALVVSKFQCLETSTTSGTKVEVCARSNAQDQARYANGVVSRIQNFLTRYLNVTYPISKMSHVALPDYVTAIENWGLILYRESNLLLDQTTTSEYAKQHMTLMIAHELAHQWFGNLVTCDWWSDIWLNEGFAIWMEILILKDINSDWDTEGQFVADRLLPTLQFDALRSSHPVYRDMNSDDDINNMFDFITYFKAGAVIRMMMKVLGETVFQRSLQVYLKRNSYRAVGHMELFETFSQEATMLGSSVRVTDRFLPWITQQGYPVIQVVYDSRSGTAQLTQEPFRYERNPEDQQSLNSQVWHVPITVVTDMDLSWENVHVQWLTDKSGSVNTTSYAKWILLNIGQSFVYRVNYEPENWNGLINQLNEDHYKLYNKENRAQIIDDLFNFARSGEVGATLALRSIEYIDKETELTPWMATLRNVEYIDNILKLTGAYPHLKRFMVQKLERQYSRLGWTTSDTHTKQHMRERILGASCYFGLEDCLEKAIALYEGWMEYPSSLKDKPNLQSVVYCIGVREGSTAAWDYLYERYLLSNSATEQETMLKSLACTTHADLLISFMHRAMNGEVRDQYFGTVMEEVAKNRNGPSVAWSFIKSNWEEMHTRYGGFFVHYVAKVAKYFSTQWQLDDLNNFLSKTLHFEVEPQELSRALEMVRINIEWRERHEDTVTAWLKEKTP